MAEIKEGNKTVGNLLYNLSTKLPESLYPRTKLLTDYIKAEKICRP